MQRWKRINHAGDGYNGASSDAGIMNNDGARIFIGAGDDRVETAVDGNEKVGRMS